MLSPGHSGLTPEWTSRLNLSLRTHAGMAYQRLDRLITYEVAEESTAVQDAWKVSQIINFIIHISHMRTLCSFLISTIDGSAINAIFFTTIVPLEVETTRDDIRAGF